MVRQQRGFTLLEVIVTMVIVVVGLVMISQVYSVGLRAAQVSDKTTVARFLAEQKIAELELLAFSELQSNSGDFGENYPEFTWSEEVSTTNLNNLRQVVLAVSWKEENKNRQLVVYRLIADRGEEIVL